MISAWSADDAKSTAAKNARASRRAGGALIARILHSIASITQASSFRGMWRRKQEDALRSRMMRLDGRAADQLRPVSFEIGIAPHASGSALVAMGNTRVICAVK